jgi:hypothetical protein
MSGERELGHDDHGLIDSFLGGPPERFLGFANHFAEGRE